MFIVVGLGNPGREYADTRHNVGYMVADLLAERWSVDIRKRRFRAVYGEGAVAGNRVALVKPTTFMNNSGWCVSDAVAWYKCAHSELVIVYDDADIPLGTIRIREGGSSGTHNGMRSVVYQLGYDDFPRVRVGIGASDGRDMISHVLGAPCAEEKVQLDAAIRDAADAVELILQGRLKDAQGRFNHKHGLPKNTDGDTQA